MNELKEYFNSISKLRRNPDACKGRYDYKRNHGPEQYACLGSQEDYGGS